MLSLGLGQGLKEELICSFRAILKVGLGFTCGSFTFKGFGVYAGLQVGLRFILGIGKDDLGFFRVLLFEGFNFRLETLQIMENKFEFETF